MDKISNYKKIVEALMKKRESLTDSTYDNMLRKLNIIEISPINETTLKIFEDYSKTELTDSNTELIIGNINKYSKTKVYGDFFRRVIPGTEEYRSISRAARLFYNEEYIMHKDIDALSLIIAKQEELRIELFKNIKELICESRINYRSDKYSCLDSMQDTEIVLNTIAAILGTTLVFSLKFELKFILGRDIDLDSYSFNMNDIKAICDYFDIDYSEIEELYNSVRC